MLNRIIIASSLAAAFLAVPSVAHAGTSCQSTWVKASKKVSKFYVPVGKFVCNQLNTEDPQAAQTCIDQLESFASTAQEIKSTWNQGEDGSWKIGPRALPLNRPQTGAVATERQFVGTPVVNEEFTLELTRTGGKAKKNLTVEICFVDPSGNDVAHETVVLSKKGRKTFTKTFRAVEGTIPLIHLNNQRWGANAHKYRIKSSASGEAAAVQQARQTVSSHSGNGKPLVRPGPINRKRVKRRRPGNR